MENALQKFTNWWSSSAFLRVLFLGFVMIILQIPISMIDSQIYERQTTRNSAIEEVSSKWGHAQDIIGPRLIVPYYEVQGWKNDKGKPQQNRVKRFASFLPEQLNISAEVKNETRYRGLFEVPLYKTQMSISGHFRQPDFSKWAIDPQLILWEQAELVMGVNDARGIQKQVDLEWGKVKYRFEPGPGKSNQDTSGFHVLLRDLDIDKDYRFSILLSLNGSQRLFFAPMGKDTQIKINANWPDPSFQGFKLPTQRNIHTDGSGFDARWNITSISRNYPQQWLTHQFAYNNIRESMVGVDFISPVDNYRMSERSLKYVVLFLLMTFVAIWLIEIIAGVRVHLLQYMFIGLGMCLFYLLLLSFAEHIGFGWSYIISSLLVVGMIGAYSKAVLKTGRRALIVGSGVAILYLYLFTLLQEQNYSMLFGSVGVFAALAAVMYITRNFDWYNLGRGSE